MGTPGQPVSGGFLKWGASVLQNPELISRPSSRKLRPMSDLVPAKDFLRRKAITEALQDYIILLNNTQSAAHLQSAENEFQSTLKGNTNSITRKGFGDRDNDNKNNDDDNQTWRVHRTSQGVEFIGVG